MDPTKNSTAESNSSSCMTSNKQTTEMNGGIGENHGNGSASLTASENMNNNNNNSDGTDKMNNDVASETLEGSSSTTYDDLFPSLPSTTGTASNNAQGLWNKKPVLNISTVTQIFHILADERKGQSTGFGVDNSIKILNSVMEKTGTKIEMASSKDQTLTFLITGKIDAVLRAKRELLSQFQTQASVQIDIPKEHHKVILGKQGSKLHELETMTATKISLPRSEEMVETITITGPREGIERAVHEIRTISDKRSKQAVEFLDIPKHLHPFINGCNGESCKAMMAAYPNVRINIPPHMNESREICVVGDKENVMKVCEEIGKMAKDLERKLCVVSVEVKKHQHKYVVGPKGNTLTEIMAETGVVIEIPPSDSPSETVTLRGPQDKLGVALTKVYDKANSFVSYVLDCPSWFHKHIIGHKGAHIQELTSGLPKVHVEFVESNNTIKIDGPPEEADKARDVLEAQVQALTKSLDFAEVPVDAKYLKHIVGKGGATVSKLKFDTNVRIFIPDVVHGICVIRIEGSKEGVKKTKQELEAMVNKMQNEKEKDLIIESRFHRSLIGQKGESIQKIREQFENVQILIPEMGVQSDIVKLRGPKDDVDGCAKVINAIYKDLVENNYQAKVPIFKQFNNFIGRGGVTIRKIRQETETRIDLPRPSSSGTSDSDVITITGKKANVEKANTMIRKLQSEMADVVTIDVMIPAKIHKTIIGAKGKLIQSIMDDCGGVHIKFPDFNSGSDKVTIQGPKNDAEKAKNMLLAMSNEKQLSSVSAEVRAKPEHHKFIIGRQGANIQSVRDKTGARIIFPSEGDEDQEAITILGTKEAVAEAKSELEKRIKDLENVVEETMTVDQKHHRYFVAKRGEVLRNIGEEFGGVVVSFPRNGVNSDKVSLRGAKNCVQCAKARIEELVHDLECRVTIDCVIEQQHHRTLMGTKGVNIQKICSDFDVQIKIPDRKPPQSAVNGDDATETETSTGSKECDIIRITGKKEKCEAAAEALRALVPVNIEVEVPYEFHRFIIGQKGAGVRQLMNTYDVNIKVPSSEQQSSTIIITGTRENVESGRKGLLERVKELEEEKNDKELKSFEVKVEVKPEYHPKIIGRRGAVITQLREQHDVNIQLPRVDAPAHEQSIITITGYETNANEAKDAILKIVKEYESMHKVDVEIDHRVHPKIIGRKGVGIRQLIKDFNVEIKLPKEGDPNPNTVTIMGSEDAVNDCMDRLLNMEEEFLQDVIDEEAMRVYEQAPLKGMQQANDRKAKEEAKGFEIGRGAPWQGASDMAAFPSLGGAPTAATVASTPVWGPRR